MIERRDRKIRQKDATKRRDKSRLYEYCIVQEMIFGKGAIPGVLSTRINNRVFSARIQYS